MGPTIISIGSINADFQMRVGDSGDEETSRAQRFSRLSGGKAANRAFLARKLGHDARLIGLVGDDDLAEQALVPLRRHGVDVDAVMHAHECATAVSIIMVPETGKKRIVLAPNANEGWQPGHIHAAVLAIEAASPDSVLAMDCEIPAPRRRAAQSGDAAPLAHRARSRTAAARWRRGGAALLAAGARMLAE